MRSQLFQVVGWGKLAEGGVPANILQQVSVPIISQKKCRHSTSYRTSEITENMFCAGFDDGKIDACQVGSKCKNLSHLHLALNFIHGMYFYNKLPNSRVTAAGRRYGKATGRIPKLRLVQRQRETLAHQFVQG